MYFDVPGTKVNPAADGNLGGQKNLCLDRRPEKYVQTHRLADIFLQIDATGLQSQGQAELGSGDWLLSSR